MTNKINANELVPLFRYLNLRAALPYLKDENTIKDILEIEKIQISPDRFKEYYSELEKETNELIEINPIARKIYLRHINPKSINNQIKDITSFGPKYLKKRFVTSLMLTAKAVKKIGFYIRGRKKGEIDVVKDSNSTKIGFYGEDWKRNIIFKVKLGDFFGDPFTKIHIDRFFSQEIDENQEYQLGNFFNKYWDEYNLNKNNEAGRHIQRIIRLEDDVQKFICKRQKNLEEIFGEY